MRENYDARHDVHEEYVVRSAIRCDDGGDALFELAGGLLAVAVIALGLLVASTQALRWLRLLP